MLILLATLNRKVMIDYRNTSNILCTVITEAFVAGILINGFTLESFSSKSLLEAAIAIACSTIIVTICITSPALLPLMFDWKAKPKNNSLGITTANPKTESTLSERIFFWIQKRLWKDFTNIMIRDKVPSAVLANELNLHSDKSKLHSKNLVNFSFLHLLFDMFTKD